MSGILNFDFGDVQDALACKDSYVAVNATWWSLWSIIIYSEVDMVIKLPTKANSLNSVFTLGAEFDLGRKHKKPFWSDRSKRIQSKTVGIKITFS